jgi:ABC-type glucose/galactose transport system permease subunit
MTFFNFEEDNLGNQQFQVSDKWWYFLAATIPLTIAVFSIWIIWQKLKFGEVKQDERKGIVEMKEFF